MFYKSSSRLEVVAGHGLSRRKIQPHCIDLETIDYLGHLWNKDLAVFDTMWYDSFEKISLIDISALHMSLKR